ncbi:unnamed protein product, partial [Ectocarpus sp. 12 AP-2014]
GQVTGDGEHRDAPVLHLHVPEALEPLLVGVGQEAERVPESEWGLRADLRLERHLHGRGRLGRGGDGGAVERAAVFSGCGRKWVPVGKPERKWSREKRSRDKQVKELGACTG